MHLSASLALVALMASANGPPADLAAMVQAEYDFAAMAKSEGYKAAFLNYLAADAVMLENGPTPAKKRVASRPDLKGTLQWYPTYAVVASTGDIGLSTGPYVIANPDNTKKGYGHFLSIWRKQPNGEWRNALDVGVSHAELKPAPEPLRVTAASGHADSTAAPRTDTSTDIRAAESQFAELVKVSGYAAAAQQLAHSELRVYREGRSPATGDTEVSTLLQERDITAVPKVEQAFGSGDFGYSYGLIAKNQFLHVWKQTNGQWQLLTDLLLALPEPPR